MYGRSQSYACQCVLHSKYIFYRRPDTHTLIPKEDRNRIRHSNVAKHVAAVSFKLRSDWHNNACDCAACNCYCIP